MIKVRILELEEEMEIVTNLPEIPKKDDQICCFFNFDDFRVCNIISIRYYLLNTGEFNEVEIGVLAC